MGLFTPPIEIGPDARPLDLNVDLEEDIYSAGTVVSSRLSPYPSMVSLDGRDFTIETQLLELATVEQLREARDEGAEPGEQSLSSAGAWKRSRVDWSLGAGQQWADEQSSDSRRFWASKGIDCWQRREICLLPATFPLVASDSAGRWQIVLSTDAVYAMTADALYRITDIDTLSPSFVDVSGTMTGLQWNTCTAAGDTIVFSDTTSIGLQDATGATDAVRATGTAGAIPWRLLQYWQGWLFGVQLDPAKPNELYYITGQANKDLHLLYTHPVDRFEWTVVEGTPYAIYAGGQSEQGTGELYRWIVKDDGTLPLAPLLAASLPANEQFLSLCYAAGSKLLVAGTNHGIRTGEIGNDGTVEFGPVITQPGPVVDLYNDAEFMCFSWSNFDPGACGVGRLHLTEFTAPLVPAWASDVMTSDGITGPISAVGVWGHSRLFGVEDGNLYWTIDKKVPEGWVDMGHFTWTCYDAKAFLGAEVIHNALVGSVALEVLNGAGQVVSSAIRDAQGSSGLGTNLVGPPSGGQGAELYDPVLHIFSDPDDQRNSSCVTRVTMRALPMLRQVNNLKLPLVVHEQIDLGVEEGQDREMDTLETWLWLKGLEQNARSVSVEIGQFSTVGTVTKVDYLAGNVRGFTSGRRWLDGVIMVQIMLREF